MLLKLTLLGMEGATTAGNLAMHTIAKVREIRARSTGLSPSVSHVVLRDFGSVTQSLEYLRMGKKHDRYRETAHMKLEPQLVQAALDRLKGKPFSIEEQQEIYNATRTPHKVKWPTWWGWPRS